MSGKPTSSIVNSGNPRNAAADRAGQPPLPLDARWARIGGGFTVSPEASRVDVEQLIIDSAVAAAQDARLYWVMTSWLAVHGKLVNLRRLGRMLDALAKSVAPTERLASAALGAAFDVAASFTGTARALRSVRKHCRPLAEPRPLFDIIARNPLLTTIAHDEGLPTFAQWGLWQNSIADKRDAIRPVTWILHMCPEFHMRSLFGADLEADVLDIIRDRPTTIADLARTTGATAPAVHEVVDNLTARGLVRRPESGYRKWISLSTDAAQLLAHALAATTMRPA